MPSLTFILPHWLYWGTLGFFPLIAMYLVRRQTRYGVPHEASLAVAYLFWLCAGFVGLHRFYLRNLWGLAFIPVFLLILFTASVSRDLREDVSRTRSDLEVAHTHVTRARPYAGVTLTPEMEQRLKAAQQAVTKAQQDFDAAEAKQARAAGYSRWLAILMAAMLLVDAVLLPGLVRRTRATETIRVSSEHTVTEIPSAGTHEDPTLAMRTPFTDAIEWVNVKAGEFVAYWAVIAVFTYYYEVVARYVFNSPTNWVHESMFLMFGMQYMMAGAFAYRDDQHVRVDVFYAKFSPRGKAIADIVTSVFFFIFIGTMLWTGWRFAADAVSLGERSFTEWSIQYWPVKLAIPIGAALLLLQGVSKLIKDIIIVTRGAA